MGGLAARLEDRYTVLRPDWLGCGDSEDWPDDEVFTLEDDRRILRELLASLDAPAHLVGHSYGGTLALWAALETPHRVARVAGAVVFGILLTTRDPEGLAHLRATMPPGFFGPGRAGTEAWLADFVDCWQGPGSWARLSEAARAPFLRSASKVVQQVEDRTSHRVYRQLQAPLLVMYGTETPPAARRGG